MKAQIRITGQIGGNFAIARKLRYYTTKKVSMFNSFLLSYDSINEAKEDIRKAYHSLCQDEPDMKGHLGGIRKENDNTTLYYDASKAEIERA
jgi:hypothetical protein